VHRRFVDDVVVAKRVDLISELFSPEAVVEQGSLDALRQQMGAQAAGLNLTVTYLHEFTDADWVIHHMAIDIEHVGDFLGAIGSGRVARLLEVEAARVVDGQIVEMWSVADRAAAMLDLGIPLPGNG
jgi:predicted ester cyclase